jgi:transposase-like protein
VAQIAQTFSVHPNLLAFWKKQAIEHLPSCFR